MHLKTERSRSDLCPHCHIIMLLGKIKENEKATGILESDEWLSRPGKWIIMTQGMNNKKKSMGKILPHWITDMKLNKKKLM